MEITLVISLSVSPVEFDNHSLSSWLMSPIWKFAYARRYQIYGCVIIAQTTATENFRHNVII